ncbi:hypothetical protein ScPMuIL_018276 [Solemya velum]
MSKLLLPQDYGFERSVSWGRYQMAVTKHKDDEDTSSSMFAMWDATDPVVNFQKYLDDDENIVDEDLVAWVTLGTQHIPQTENLPTTVTVGGQLQFYILPFNYFDEDQSMHSRDAVRITPKDPKHPLDGADVERYHNKHERVCIPQHKLPDKLLETNSTFLFSNGLYILFTPAKGGCFIRNLVSDSGNNYIKMSDNGDETHQLQLRKLRYTIIGLIVLSLFLLALVVVIYAIMDRKVHARSVPICPTGDNNINLNGHHSVFSGLTKEEIEGLQQYLYSKSDLNLVRPSEASINASYIFTADLYLPQKSEVLRHLDYGEPMPRREALVVIIRGDKAEPIIEEYIVGPLPKPHYISIFPRKGRQSAVPLSYVPISGPIRVAIVHEMNMKVDQILRKLLLESYGATFTNCANKCLVFRHHTTIPSVISGDESRQICLWAFHFVEFYTLNPIHFFICIKTTNKIFIVNHVIYNGQKFPSLEDLMRKYNNGSIEKSILPFPVVDSNYFSILKRRGPSPQNNPRRPPRQVEPDGKRYSIQGRHVSYMDWQFHFKMSVQFGPQLFDIKFRGERIVYELSLQEISVFYSGNTPILKFGNFLDSIGLIGASSNSLVPGSDCPETATLVDFSYLHEDSEDVKTNKNAFCIFELDTGVPLRRHHSYWRFLGQMYEGVSDVALTLRTIASIANYDYVFDFVFHQNGAMGVKVSPTGYIASLPYTSLDSQYGFRLHDVIAGPIHHHMFHFKADLDIKGTDNRFETLDVTEQKVPRGSFSNNPDQVHSQTNFVSSLKRTEAESTYKFNFSTPRYLLFTNDKTKSKYGNTRGYRLLTSGIAKQMAAEGLGNEPTISWARYQVAVTRQKDDERESSSIYGSWDAHDPVVRFQNFIDDDEDIIDQDLVAWITLGTHHIPRTEDLPIVTTVGMSLDFFLLPFNYFDEDPAISSTDAIRVDPYDKDGERIGVERYGVKGGFRCVPEKHDIDAELKANSESYFGYS